MEAAFRDAVFREADAAAEAYDTALALTTNPVERAPPCPPPP
ncbi:hypothetical protein [Pseudonocardia sp. NPDC049154]